MADESAAARGALKKLHGQLCYLNEELLALAFFDRDIGTSEKRVETLSQAREMEPPKKTFLDQSHIHVKTSGIYDREHTKFLPDSIPS